MIVEATNVVWIHDCLNDTKLWNFEEMTVLKGNERSFSEKELTVCNESSLEKKSVLRIDCLMFKSGRIFKGLARPELILIADFIPKCACFIKRLKLDSEVMKLSW